MSWAWSQLQKSGPAKTGPAGPLATALVVDEGETLGVPIFCMSELYDILGVVLFNILGVTVFDVLAEEMDVISAADSEIAKLTGPFFQW